MTQPDMVDFSAVYGLIPNDQMIGAHTTLNNQCCLIYMYCVPRLCNGAVLSCPVAQQGSVEAVPLRNRAVLKLSLCATGQC